MAIDPHLQSMYNALCIPQATQAMLHNKYGISDYCSLKANKLLLGNKELDQIAGPMQTIIASALVYLEYLSRDSGDDPLPRFTEQGWEEFAIQKAAAMVEAMRDRPEGASDDDVEMAHAEPMDEDGKDDQVDGEGSFDKSKNMPAPYRFWAKNNSEEDDDEALTEEERLELVGLVMDAQMDLMVQGFHPSESGGQGSDNDGKTEELPLLSVKIEGREFYKGRCYHFQNKKGNAVIVGIKSFKSETEINCVRVVPISKTFLGHGDTNGEFQAAFANLVSDKTSPPYVQVQGFTVLALSSLGRECAAPDPVSIPDIIYEPQTPGNWQSFGYIKDVESIGANRTRVPREEIRLLEGFCGAGGMHLGFQDAGLKTVLAVDINEDAIRTFNHNNPGVHAERRDILELIQELQNNSEARKALGRIDAVHVSSPCQGFSKASRFGGKDDDANNALSYTFVELLRLTDALVGTFENVEGMWSQKGMPYLRKLLLGCIELGYQVCGMVLKSKCPL